LGPRAAHVNVSAEPVDVLAMCSDFVPEWTGVAANSFTVGFGAPYTFGNQ